MNDLEVPAVVLDAFRADLHRISDDGCDDNYRFAPANDDEALADYDDAKRDGCCGSFDSTIEVDGILWHYGFNYGH